MVDEEIKRLETHGVTPLKQTVIDSSVIVHGKNNQINTVFVDTEMDFKQIDNILLSAPIPSPIAPGWHHLHVVLYASNISQTTPLIIGYLYKTRLKQAKSKNNLKHWKFINRKGEEAEHVV